MGRGELTGDEGGDGRKKKAVEKEGRTGRKEDGQTLSRWSRGETERPVFELLD